MAHIAEGLMHAYLDGALGPDGQLEWAAAEAHLEACAECRERFDEARELRSKADEILDDAQPAVPAGPAFAALVAEAEARDRTKRRRSTWWGSTARLAWAASLVIAAGAGWIGHELLMQQGPSGSPSLARSPAAETVGAVAERRQPARADGAKLDAPVEERAEDADAGRAAAEREAAEPEAAEPGAAAQLMAPQADRALAGRAREAPAGRSCFSPRTGVAGSGQPGAVGVLVLRADGTLRTEAGRRPLVGFWDELPADSLRLRLTDGSGWFVYRVRRSESGLSGISSEGEAVGFGRAECPP